MSSRSLPSSYKIYDAGKGAHPEGWTEWQETSFPEIWATKKTEYSPDIAEIGNPVYFDRESHAFFDALRNGTPSVVPATQAYNISRVIEAMFASSKQAGAEIFID
jgi:predicted dehydrogenase